MSAKPTFRLPPQIEKLLTQLQQRFEPLAPREKAIVTLVLLTTVFMVVQLVALDPLLKKRDELLQQQDQVLQDFNMQQIERETLAQAIAAGPKRQKQQQLETLQQELVMLDEQIARTTATMIPPRKMTDVLREVMQLRENLKLVELENLAPQPLLEDTKLADTPKPGNPSAPVDPANTSINPNADIDSVGELVATKMAQERAAEARIQAAIMQAQPSEVGLYRHGVKLVFEGDYVTTMAFLESLEQKSWRFFWQSLQYDVEKYPKARITLTLYTLSPERAWLGV